MAKSNQFKHFQNGTITAILTEYYLNFVKPIFRPKIMGAEIKVLKDTKRTPLCIFFNELWVLLEESLQFSSTYEYSDFDAGVRAILTRKPDIFLAPLVTLPWKRKRRSWDVLNIPLRIWYEVHVKQPPQIASSEFYIAVLPTKIWLLYAFSLIGFPLIFWILMNCSYKSIGVMKQSYMDFFVNVVGIFSSQGLQKEPKMNSMRLFALNILVYGYLMNIAYSALLIAKLSVAVATLPFQSLEELGMMDSYQVCVNNNSHGHAYFTVELPVGEVSAYSPQWINRINGKECQHEGGQLIRDKLLPAMCNKQIVAMTISSPPMDFSTESSSCNIVPLKQRYMQNTVSPIISKYFLYLDQINEKTIRIAECGLMNYIYKKQVKKFKVKNLQPAKHIISFLHVKDVFGLYFSAIFISIGLLIIEILVFKYRVNIVQ